MDVRVLFRVKPALMKFFNESHFPKGNPAKSEGLSVPKLLQKNSQYMIFLCIH